MTEPPNPIRTLDYASPQPSDSPDRQRLARAFAYIVGIIWCGVLTIASVPHLVSNSVGTSVRTATALTFASILAATLLRRALGRAGCVTAFITFAVAALAVLWLSV